MRNERVISEKLIRKSLEGSGRGLFKVLSLNLEGLRITKKNFNNEGWSLGRSVNHSTMTFCF
jgi:hypothetical protein